MQPPVGGRLLGYNELTNFKMRLCLNYTDGDSISFCSTACHDTVMDDSEMQHIRGRLRVCARCMFAVFSVSGPKNIQPKQQNVGIAFVSFFDVPNE